MTHIDRIREHVECITPGNWLWSGYRSARSLQLLSDAPRRPVVMLFERWGMNDAAPSFAVGRVEKVLGGSPEGHRTVPAVGIMTRADELVPEPDGDRITTIDHPDAQFLAAAPGYVRDLLSEVDRLRAERDALHIVLAAAQDWAYGTGGSETDQAERLNLAVTEHDRLVDEQAGQRALAAEGVA